MESRLPEFLKPYFWDVKFEGLEVDRSAEFIINRLLDKGGWQAAKWVEITYPKELVQKVLRTNRDFSLRNATFWGLIYGVPEPQIKCLSEPYRTMRKTLWPY